MFLDVIRLWIVPEQLEQLQCQLIEEFILMLCVNMGFELGYKNLIQLLHEKSFVRCAFVIRPESVQEIILTL